MVAADILDLRLAALRRTLDIARDAIPVVHRLDRALQQRLADRVERRIVEASNGLAAADRNSGSFQRRISDGEELVGEILAFLAAAAARNIHLDQGVTTLAMIWLDRLSDILDLPPVAVVIPATEEFTGIASSIVRLQVPLDGVWGLPVAIHEYGHFVAANLTRRQEVEATIRTVTPAEDLLHNAATKAELPMLYGHGHELFADAFAAATIGPAYLHYCLRYRFLPGAAQEITSTHPSKVRRIRIQLAVLEKLAEDDSAGFLSGDVGVLQDYWHAELTAADVSREVPPNKPLDTLEREIVDLVLQDEKLRRVRYHNHPSAQLLADNNLETRDLPDPALVVNGAWCLRMKIERDADSAAQVVSELTQVAERMHALLRRVMADG